MTTIRNWFNHFFMPHYPSLDPARLGMAAARSSGYSKRRVESCEVCDGFVLRLER